LVPYKGPIKNWSFPNFGTDKGYINGITGFCIMLPRLLLIISGNFRKHWISGKLTTVLRIEVRPTALLCYHAHTRWTLTFDLNITFSPRRAMTSPPHTTHIHTHKLNFKCQSLQKRVETNEQTEEHYQLLCLPV